MWRMSSIEVMIFIALVVVIVAVLLACQLRSGSASRRVPDQRERRKVGQ